MSSSELFAKANALEQEVNELRKQASEEHRRELLAKALGDRLVYAAYSRCPCGAGLAYDPAYEDKESVFIGTFSGFWHCSAILLDRADKNAKHTDKLPFAFYEIKAEGQPSAQGATTRPK